MNKVLFVSKDNDLLAKLSNELPGTLNNAFTVATVATATEAEAYLHKESIDLIVFDIDQANGSGFQFLAQMNKNRPDLPTIALADLSEPTFQTRLDGLGLFGRIDKPIDFKQLDAVIIDGLAAGVKGHISGVALASVLQLIELEHKTCTLTISSAGRTGTFFFRNGTLLNARHEDLEGLGAALEIAGWEQTRIEFQNFCPADSQVITEPLAFILMESARRQDEKDSDDEPASFFSTPASLDDISLGTEEVEGLDEIFSDSFEAFGEDRRAEFDVDREMKEGPLAATLLKIQNAVARAIGPIAKMIVKEKIGEWAMAGDPSVQRLGELVSLLEEEIDDADQVKEFRAEVASCLQ